MTIASRPRRTQWGAAADRLDPPVDWTQDPDGWVKDRLRETIWSKQTDILRSVRDNRRTGVHSCHESGKSFIAARAVAWWLESHLPGEAFAVTTAPTGAQVKAILWREINRAHVRGRLMGRCLTTEWKVGNELVAFGRKPSDYNTEAFQGIHARYVLVVIDEANGVPKSLWDAAETLIANESGRILAIGNPDDPSSYFAEVCKPGSGWSVIHIAAADTPNFTGEYVPKDVGEMLISPMWAEEKRKSWGEESPIYISKVLGEFPPYATDTVVPWQWVTKCRLPAEDVLVGAEDEVEPDAELGVDVGAGGDQTVIWLRRGLRAIRKESDHTADPKNVVGKVMQMIRQERVTRVKIDTIGIGWGVAGWVEEECKELDWEVDVVRVNVAESPQDRTRFHNLRDEIWWDIGRELSRLGRWQLEAVDDDTIAQLVAPKYSIKANGLIKVEPKDEVRKRLGRSPDDADALLMAFYDVPREIWRAV